MATLKAFNTNFSTIANAVDEIAKTENTYKVTAASAISNDIIDYTDYGLATLGKIVGFPAPFVQKVNETNTELAREIISDRTELYFEKKGKPFSAREFLGKISGVVSDRYAIFDDSQVIEVVENSPLADIPYAHAEVSPERLHLRAIDKENPFYVGEDKSPLYFCYFVDNSMVGQSSFKVQLGVYRLACTNGMIMPVKEFIICRQVHRGARDICAEFNQSISFLNDKRNDLKALLTDLTTAESALEDMKADYRANYLARALNLSQKESESVLKLYYGTYGGKTRWDLVNAITEFARDTKSIDRREYLEKKALKVA